ncbi:S41 family peptidase [Lentiprolixibacter aurantiacus]|uniref:S41 family peptidase n=1 Tax=Lentiprolixibacter aurantiacus TaxID=2993939 RepID=A0AAE3MMS7_9FLAO|nr:S41 family peptidase [Lentiprolixibacter aurantiacus]MCX2720216.1 S41 family peptidase [Lentiprolixibacter aurantiacus]
MKKYIFLLLTVGLLALGCSKNNDDDNGPDPVGNADLDTQHFMWQSLNLWYYWQAEVPNLADDRFSSDQEYTEFLGSESDPAAFFENKLRFSGDRFTFYREDFKDLVRGLDGISRSNGLEFSLTYIDSNDNDLLDNDEIIYGIVRYIVNGSNAATVDISRGEIFTGVDGQELNGANYQDLLFGENATYTLNMADIDGGTLTPNGKEVTLTKEEGLLENPVYITTTLDVMGTKIGYLMYNGFTDVARDDAGNIIADYDEELNSAFGELVSQGATELVLDLRYNPGGSVRTAQLLSSMIYGTDNTNLVLWRQEYNPKLQAIFDPAQLEDTFLNQTPRAGTPLNTLNLNRVYVLTTRSSASASELVINGLAPYMDVVQIGSTTRGKIEFSLTLVDDPDREGAPYIYSPSRENQINPNNLWGMQAIVGVTANSVGFSAPNGLEPDIQLFENAQNMGILGDVNEPLLARAIQEITGMSGRRDFTVDIPVKEITNSKMFTTLKDNMYLDKPIKLDFIPE